VRVSVAQSNNFCEYTQKHLVYTHTPHASMHAYTCIHNKMASLMYVPLSQCATYPRFYMLL